eukprot:gnl/TRDRNA2_/TRDRNA2_80511_c0_seq1.p1 gnl/TRDRNA2_/TRDRNA2_80511_c0~~gnl/TRDRNA2_/TRDRNA2_80511_c0_seq1.p1  ORF type:complete len:155 (+),score=50.61 gnl/TRDRNA2_/TRDRNA2_80511_c0_seq1:91-555(+)
MPEEEEEKEKYKADLIRLRDSKTQLDTDDLDEDEKRALAEVGKKGYYHARPKTEEAPMPQKIQEGEALPERGKGFVRKRNSFDKYQQKWDQFEKKEPVVTVKDEAPPTKVSSPVAASAKAAADEGPSLMMLVSVIGVMSVSAFILYKVLQKKAE